MKTGRTPRATAVLLASLTAVFGVALAGPAAAQTSPSPLTAEQAAPVAAGWLAGQLVDGNHLEVVFGDQKFPDPGLTADAVLAFDAVDVGQDHAAAATKWLAGDDVLPGYVGDGTTESYSGALAKLALVAMAQGQDPGSFGGVPLIEQLKARQDPASGRFSDKSQHGDFTNGITQSLAIVALLRHDERADVGKPVDFLAASQCGDGGFPLEFGKPICSGEVDVTAFAVQALIAAGRDATAALDYLTDAQADDGGFGGSGPTSGINANSTGLAAQALRVGGRTEEAEAAVKYLLGQQVGCAEPTERRGAIAYDANGFDPTTAVRATVQSLYGLTGADLSKISNEGDAATAPLACAPPSATTSQPQENSGASGESPAKGRWLAPAAGLGALLVAAAVGALLLHRQRRTRRP